MSQPASEPASAPALRHIPRRYLALGLIIVAICLLGALVLVRDNSGPSTTSTVETFSPAPSSLLSTLTSVPASVYDAVGVSSPDNPVQAPQPAGNASAPMWLATNGGAPQPVVFFYGAEFAPYAAVQRWPLILALSRFGTFNELGVMQSSGTTAFADLSTFTFWKVSYTSKYLILESVERYSSLNPTGGRYLGLQRPTARQAAAIASYGADATTFALTDVANRYVLNGASFAPGVLAGLTQSQIAGNLNTPASPLTQAVVSAANEITASICAVDGDKPGAVCESKGVLAADQVLKISPPR
ncbi:MAG TPA: DUF929 family protein [Acidimicrobiales bacterium]|jgi:hypothetical protein|nr:DUF929 family protein [Acidimicrobiales bacterium]